MKMENGKQKDLFSLKETEICLENCPLPNGESKGKRCYVLCS